MRHDLQENQSHYRIRDHSIMIRVACLLLLSARALAAPASPPAPGGELPSPGGELPAPGGELPASGGEFPAPGGVLPAPGGVLPAPGGELPAPGGELPAPGGELPAPGSEQPTPGRAAGPHGVLTDLLVRTTWKFKRSTSAEDPDSDHVSRKQFIVKLLCQTNKCAHTQVYEFDLLGANGADGNGVYY